MARTEVRGGQILDASVSLTADVTGTLPVANGGTGAATLTSNNVLLGNGTSAPQAVAPSTSGNVLRSNGTTWASSALNGATLVVAASTASAGVKAHADYICDGTADEVEINAALAALPSSKGTVVLTSGTFTTAASINLGTSQTLSGQGEDSTIISGSATTFHVIHMGNRTGGAGNAMTNFVKLRDLSVTSAGGANSFDTVWADGVGIGSMIENVKASEGKYNFRITDADQCAFYNIKGFNPRTASIYCEVGYENTFGNVAFYSPSMALSDNSSTGFLIDANAVQGGPNRVDRLSINGALIYSGTSLTGTVGIKTNVGASSFVVSGSLIENFVTHVELNDTTQLTWIANTMLHNAGPSTNGFRCVNDAHSITIISSRFQQMTNLFNGVSGNAHIVFLGRSENQGSITNLMTGSFGSKQGTDTVFIGNGVMALGLNNERYDYLFTNIIELGDSGDTTLTRASAGVLALEGVAIPTISSTNTLTNKRVTPRVVAVSNTTSWTINSDTTDFAENTGLTGAVTINNPSGTPTQGQRLWITLTGTASRGISYGSAFEDSTVIRPTTTSGTAALDIGFRWNSVTSKWRCIAYG